MTNAKPLRIRYYKTRLGRWSWALYSGNSVNWSSPSKGFSSLGNAQRSFNDMVKALGGDPTAVLVQIHNRREKP